MKIVKSYYRTVTIEELNEIFFILTGNKMRVHYSDMYGNVLQTKFVSDGKVINKDSTILRIVDIWEDVMCYFDDDSDFISKKITYIKFESYDVKTQYVRDYVLDVNVFLGNYISNEGKYPRIMKNETGLCFYKYNPNGEKEENEKTSSNGSEKNNSQETNTSCKDYKGYDRSDIWDKARNDFQQAMKELKQERLNKADKETLQRILDDINGVNNPVKYTFAYKDPNKITNNTDNKYTENKNKKAYEQGYNDGKNYCKSCEACNYLKTNKNINKDSKKNPFKFSIVNKDGKRYEFDNLEEFIAFIEKNKIFAVNGQSVEENDIFKILKLLFGDIFGDAK